MQLNASLSGLFCHRLPANPQVTNDACEISAGIFWLSLKELRMLRKLDYQGRFWKANDRSCHSLAEKKTQAIFRGWKYVFLHGDEWDWSIVHQTVVAKVLKIDARTTLWRAQVNIFYICLVGRMKFVSLEFGLGPLSQSYSSFSSRTPNMTEILLIWK